MKYFDLTSQEIIANPYPTYAKMRAAGPVVRGKVPFSKDVYIVSRYKDVVSGLKNPKILNKMKWSTGVKNERINQMLKPKMMQAIEQSMLAQDGDEHRRLRRLVHLAFTPKQVSKLASNIDTVVEQRLSNLNDGDSIDLLSDYSSKLSITTIGDLINVPQRDRQRFEYETHNFLRERQSSMLFLLDQVRSGLKLFRIIRRIIRKRSQNLGDDFVSKLILAESEDGKLSREEVEAMLFVILLGGYQTTSHLIASGFYTLFQHPEQLNLLKEDLSLIDSTVEEILRYTSSVGHGAIRKIVEDTDIDGVTVKKDNQILFLLSAANHDETVFDSPGIFDIQRENNKHIAFGGGPHFCLGAALAKLEAKTSIKKLFEQFPKTELSPDIDHNDWAYTLASRSLRSVPVILRR